MDSKSIFASKVFWANVLMLALTILDNGFFGGMVPADTKATIVAVVNIALRFLSTGTVTVTGKG
jgi:hypothetical protein